MEPIDFIAQCFGSVLDLWRRYLGARWSTWLGGIVAFILAAALYVLLTQPDMRRRPIRQLLRKIFPAHLYGRATYVDKWNVLISILTYLPVLQVLLAIPVLLLGVKLSHLLGTSFGEIPRWIHGEWAAAAAQFAGLFLGNSFFAYWAHYGMHRVPLLWRIHRPHHSAEALTPLANWRAHPLEIAIIAWFDVWGGVLGSALALYLTGTELVPQTAQIAIAVGAVSQIVFGFLGHSHIPISFGRCNAILGAPVMHQIHHSAELRHRDKNFGGFLMLWDVLFGTFYNPAPGEVYRWGLNDEERGENNPHRTMRDFYLEPFRRRAKRPSDCADNT